MSQPPFKFILVAAIVAVAGATWFFAFRRAPACSGDGRYMATVQQCRSYGLDAGLCRQAVDKARALAVRVAPKAATSFDCEVLYSECFETPDGRFTPSPSFCLASSGAPEPVEVRYLEYGSDRLNRKKTREVRID